jgi:glycosyltransferase involved in cell wall biosynthesis
MSKSEFYIQLSISEGFPNSICEAMLLECIPIGTCVGAMPDIIGDTGIVITENDFDKIKNEIQRLVRLDPEAKEVLSQKARRRISERYPLSKREALLVRYIDEATDRVT